MFEYGFASALDPRVFRLDSLWSLGELYVLLLFVTVWLEVESSRQYGVVVKRQKPGNALLT